MGRVGEGHHSLAQGLLAHGLKERKLGGCAGMGLFAHGLDDGAWVNPLVDVQGE
jgi:hypothetical protein